MNENSDSSITLNISSPSAKPRNDEDVKRPRISGSRVTIVIVIGIRDTIIPVIPAATPLSVA